MKILNRNDSGAVTKAKLNEYEFMLIFDALADAARGAKADDMIKLRESLCGVNGVELTFDGRGKNGL